MNRASDPAHMVIQNVAFDPETIVITYSLQSDVRISGARTVMINSQQITVTRTEDFLEPIESLEDDVKDLVLDIAALFSNSRSAVEAEAEADAEERDDDEFRGMGE